MKATEFLADIDRIVNASIEGSQFKPCCTKGCHHCCSEALYVGEEEVDYMLAGLTEEHRQRVTAKTITWLEKARPLLQGPLNEKGLFNGFTWLESKNPCPFLEGNLCSVHDRRPSSCRLWFAIGDPNDCQMPMRRKQKIAEFDMGHPAFDRAFSKLYAGARRIKIDLLGCFLAEKLLGEKVTSAAGMERTRESKAYETHP